MPSLPPSSLAWLARRAREEPDATAILYAGKPISWKRFDADARRVAARLAREGLQEGRVAAVAQADAYLHWLLLVACEAMGVVTLSFALQAGAPEGVDWVLAEEKPQGASGVPCVVVGKAWMAKALALPPAWRQDAPPSWDWETPLRIVRSSGTTGKQKSMLLRLRHHDAWIKFVSDVHEFSKDSRFFIAYPFSANTVYARAAACLRLGAVTIIDADISAMRRRRATHAWFIPALLETLLVKPPQGFAKTPGLRVMTGGGFVSPDLWDKTLARVGDRIDVGYGTNELAGGVAHMDRDGTALPFPFARARVADEAGREVEEGERGRLWLKTPGMTEGYIGNEEETAQSFKDGWFLSGDIGERLPGGRFRILGRQDEMLNLAGLKVAPQTVEDKIRETILEIEDIAVAMANEDQGADLLMLAVAKPGFGAQDVAEKIARHFPKNVGKVRLKIVAALPRTANGKLRRKEIGDFFAKKA